MLALVLLAINLMGIRLTGAGYDAETGGSVADWFAAISTLVAVPAAVLVGVRQLQSATEALELGRRQLAAEETERAERRGAERARLTDALRLDVQVVTMVDEADMATGDERAAVEGWRAEYRQRGWVPVDGGRAWKRGGARRTHAEQLAIEPSPLLPSPWLVVAECRNEGTDTVAIDRWTVVVGGAPEDVPGPATVGPGQRARHRLGRDAGLEPAYASSSAAEAAAASVTLLLDGSVAGHDIRLQHASRGR